MNIRQALVEIERSARYVEIREQQRQRVVFDDSRAWEWFGGEEDILDPFNDYSYRWLLRALESINAWLDEYEHIEEYDPTEDIDAAVDVYTSDLTAWLHDRATNLEYLTEVLCELEPKDGFQLLTMAQATAIGETFEAVMARVRLLLAEEEPAAVVTAE